MEKEYKDRPCPQCGYMIPGKQKYCPSCGTRVGRVSTTCEFPGSYKDYIKKD